MIKAEALTKKFEDFTALNKLYCNIPEGCIYGLIGANGAGKSTFLRLISGIYKADEGVVHFNGEGVYENPSIKNQIAFVPDELFFLPQASMNRMARLYRSIYENFSNERFTELTNLFGLNPKKNINTFSKGMKRQAATILALSCRPRYLFFDETFDGLDPVMRNLVKNVIYKDVYDNHTTVVISSHSLRELEDTCDQLALLHKGGLLFESDIENLKTSLFKLQVAFDFDYDATLFEQIEGIQLVSFQKKGKVANLIVRGSKEKLTEALKEKSPILMDILPLSLEEVFVHEMEALGYAFNNQ